MNVLYVTNQVFALSKSNKMMFSLLEKLEHKVFWAANFNSYVGDISTIPCDIVQIDLTSNPLNKTNVKAYRQLCRAVAENSIEAMHCHTPIGSLLGRVVAKKMGIAPVIYTAHGFLFFEGAPRVSGMVFRMEESLLARCTDALVTINEMDYQAARKFKLRNGGRLYKVHGAGIEAQVDRGKTAGLRKALSLEGKTLCFSAARVDSNKNIETVLKAISLVPDRNIHYVVAGDGPDLSRLKERADRLGVADRVHFLGYRLDVSELLNEIDIFVLSSIREGLSRSVMEAMSHGLPCVLSQARGNQDLVAHGVGGYICETLNPQSYAEAIRRLAASEGLRAKMGERNRASVEEFSLSNVREEYREIYERHLVEGIRR
ncbi:glycosyltransferase [Gordonibacter sp. RACS_AR49]|uniref:glycosyltransferase n=1 Tax=Gordonibacter sp. RACS_AR49 TaxID=2871986 RepID=UPI00261F3C93|nr:glycosyltransferase [Gordonibacter sp. RACS_AR49]MDN4509350.1 glycosyltransferase [Gordonibacter sp. RACS_AR49]